MEQQQQLILDLTKICRVCLTAQQSMKNLQDSNFNSLWNMLIDVVNTQEIHIKDSLPYYLCGDCENNLTISFNFKRTYNRSSEIIRDRIRHNNATKCDDDSLEIEQSKDDVIKDQIVNNIVSARSYVSEEEENSVDGDDTVSSHNSASIDDDLADDRFAEEDLGAEEDSVAKEDCVAEEDHVAEEDLGAKEDHVVEEDCVAEEQIDEANHAPAAESANANNDFDVEDDDLTANNNIKDKSNHNKGKRFPKKKLKVYPDKAIKDALEELNKSCVENKQCICCSFIAAHKGALLMHVTLAHKEAKNVWCSMCKQQFPDIRKHLEEHNKMYCKFCNKPFTKKGHLIEHIIYHGNMRPYECDKCKGNYKTRGALKEHIAKYCKRQKFKCDKCSSGFPDKVQLKEHLVYCLLNSLPNKEQQTPKEEVEVKTKSDDGKLCTFCGKKFKNTSRLHVHMRIHTGETPYKCEYCGKGTRTSHHLVTHLRTHTGEKPHVCHVCGKGFRQSCLLNTHMRIHTGKPEVCNVCGQRFCRPSELKLHMRKHTGEKPYTCTDCGKAFRLSSHLKEHSKIHSCEKPFQCNYCERSFKRKCSLNCHVQIHLGKQFKCTQCPYECSKNEYLKRHVSLQHNKDASATS